MCLSYSTVSGNGWVESFDDGIFTTKSLQGYEMKAVRFLPIPSTENYSGNLNLLLKIKKQDLLNNPQGRVKHYSATYFYSPPLLKFTFLSYFPKKI